MRSDDTHTDRDRVGNTHTHRDTVNVCNEVFCVCGMTRFVLVCFWEGSEFGFGFLAAMEEMKWASDEI